MNSWRKITAVVFVALLFVSSPVGAIGGKTKAEVDVELNVEPYAVINAEDIEGNDWMPGSIETGDTSSKDSFSGQPGETRWAKTQVAVQANTGVSIKFNVKSFPNPDLSDKLVKIYVSSLEKNNSVTSEFDGGANCTQTFKYPGDREKKENIFNVKVEAQMPEEFWQIESGTYQGTINITVSSL